VLKKDCFPKFNLIFIGRGGFRREGREGGDRGRGESKLQKFCIKFF
jgi:hypothetical protein